MPVSRLAPIRDQRGMTLIELVVAMAAGMIVFAGVTTMVVASLHQSTRVTRKVHATQEARTTVHRIVTELHSACVAAEVAPILEGSSGTSISFVFQTGSAATLTPVMHKISLSGTELIMSSYPSTSGSIPEWTFSNTASSTTTLMTNVSAVSSSQPIFTYYKYVNGQVSSTPLTVPLSEADALVAVQVDIALKVTPPGPTTGAAKQPGIVQDSAFLRFTPPGGKTTALNFPCE
jgi:prepilin-type N-terminal cleavage/methylation domain-containing protein